MPSATARRLFVVLLVVSLLAVAPASAQSVRGGGTVTVPAGTVHEGDLSVVSGSVVIDGTVDGSLQGIAGSVVVTGTVTGDVEAAAGSMTIRGTVEGNVESATGSVSILEGARVGGNVEAGSGSLSIAGTVAGNVRADVGSLTVAETANIGGDLTYATESFSIADGAEITGTTRQVDSLAVDVGVPFVGFGDVGALFATSVFAFFGFLVNLLLGGVLLFAAPRFADRVTDAGRSETLETSVFGLVAFVGIPIALVLLAITIVGLPLSLAGIFAYLLLLWVAFVYGALIVGTWLLSLAGYDSRLGGLVVGLLVPAVLALVFLGDILSFIYLILGLGAFVRAALAVRRGRELPPTEGEREMTDEDEESTDGPQPI